MYVMHTKHQVCCWLVPIWIMSFRFLCLFIHHSSWVYVWGSGVEMALLADLPGVPGLEHSSLCSGHPEEQLRKQRGTFISDPCPLSLFPLITPFFTSFRASSSLSLSLSLPFPWYPPVTVHPSLPLSISFILTSVPHANLPGISIIASRGHIGSQRLIPLSWS